MKNHCQNFIQQYQNITLLKQEFDGMFQKAKETKDFTKLKEVKKELGRMVKALKELLESEEYLSEQVVYLENNMTRRSKRAIIQLQKALNEGAEEVGEEPKLVGKDLPVGEMDSITYCRIQLNEEGEIRQFNLNNTKITSLDNVTLPDSLRELHLNNTKITSLDKVKLPDSLRYLDLNNTKITSLDKVTFPDGVVYLNLNNTKITSLDNVIFPDRLRRLFLENTKITSIDNVTFPDGFEWLDLGNTKIISLDKVKLPNGLERLYLTGTPLAKDPAKLQALKAKYPNIRRIST